MAIKTWTSERVTSADINAYLTNAGLDYVSTATASSVTTLTISGFSSTWENYRLVYSNFTGNTGSGIFIQVANSGTAAATAYYSALTGYTYAGATAFNNVNNGTTTILGIAHSTIPCFGTVDISRINVAANTSFVAQAQSGTAIYAGGGYHGTATAYSQVIVTIFGGTAFSGTFRLYGYRQA